MPDYLQPPKQLGKRNSDEDLGKSHAEKKVRGEKED